MTTHDQQSSLDEIPLRLIIEKAHEQGPFRRISHSGLLKALGGIALTPETLQEVGGLYATIYDGFETPDASLPEPDPSEVLAIIDPSHWMTEGVAQLLDKAVADFMNTTTLRKIVAADIADALANKFGVDMTDGEVRARFTRQVAHSRSKLEPKLQTKQFNLTRALTEYLAQGGNSSVESIQAYLNDNYAVVTLASEIRDALRKYNKKQSQNKTR